MTIFKNIKILYNFCLNRKFITFLALLFFCILASTDSILLFLGEYEIRYIVENLSISNISRVILLVALMRVVLSIIVYFNGKIHFYKIFFSSLKKFLSSLAQNKEMFGTNQVLHNILKYELEINFISREVNYHFLTILSYFAYFIIFTSSSFKILFTYYNQYYAISIVIALLYILCITVLQILRTKIKFNNFKVIEKGLLISNEETLRFIGKENIKNNSEKYQIFVNEQIEKIKSVFLSALKKKSFTKIAIVLIESTSYLAIFYLSLLGFQENSNSPFISFVIYNLFALFFGVRFLSKMRDANVFALISQQNAQMAKTENQDEASSSDSSSGNEILIENIEFQDVDLEIKNHAIISKVNFFAKIKDNIAFLSSENNISLIRLFFENQDIKISGRSSINNYELHELKKENLAQIISVISWEINVDNDTIKNNLIQGNAGISDELLVKACKLSYLYNFIALLPLGFFTILNNSIELTKLEKFQISLTRALLGDAHIIVVDFTG